MLISDDRRAVFVHVQKTGGVTVQSMLEGAWTDARRHRPVRRHATWAEILEEEPGLADYFAFAFVRNPWSRMVSWWEMVQGFGRRAERGDADARRHLDTNAFLSAASGYTDFEEFVGRGPDEHPRLRTPQLAYVTSPGRDVDLVGRTETLAADLARAFERMGLAHPPEVPRRNATRRTADWRTYYSARARQRVGEVFADDVAAFGYRFEA